MRSLFVASTSENGASRHRLHGKRRKEECPIQDMNTTSPGLTASASLIQNTLSRTSVRILHHDSLAPKILRMAGQRDRRQEHLATPTEMEGSRVLVNFGGKKRLISSTKFLGISESSTKIHWSRQIRDNGYFL